MTKPNQKPQNPNFSSGPCSKRPGWSLENLSDAFLGRSHRSGAGKKKLKDVIEKHREILGIPSDYHIGIVPASDTGAIEMAMWSMMGARDVDVLVWESFSGDWMKDVCDHLKLAANVYKAPYGEIPDLSQVNPDNDCVFVWNGTTSGVRVPDALWISTDRKGLTFCDATSAVFAYEMDWQKLDVTTWSWQKVLGGEAAHGMLVLSPRAVERLESYVPENRPLPKIFRMTKGGKLNEGIFQGLTINTPSMLAVEDCLDALKWVEDIGGVSKTIERCRENLSVIERWVMKTDWAEFLAADPSVRSQTSVCLSITDEWFKGLNEDDKQAFIASFCKALEAENVAYDIKSYRDAPAGLRIWAGATIESSDLKALMPWLDWAFELTKEQSHAKAA